MAGDLSLDKITLTQRMINDLVRAKLKLTVLVDCSHNEFVRTVRADRPAQPIIAKPIELDATLSIPNAAELNKAVGTLQSARSTSGLFKLYKALQIGLRDGFDTLRTRNVKLEFPNFDATVFDPNSPPPGLQKAVAACTATTVAAFNALDDDIRLSMGMYERRNAMSYVLSGRAEPRPRVAVP